MVHHALERQNKCWQSFHIYTLASFDAFLSKCIQPLIAELRRKSLIEKYFFIRYWEKGPHIRLRLLCEISDATTVEAEVKFFVAEYFNVLVKRHETRSLPGYKMERDVYEPEYERYGGAKLMDLAETQFQLSSDIVLAILSAPEFDSRTRISLGLYLQVLFMYACKLELNDVSNISRVICNSWIRHQVSISNAEVTGKEIADFYLSGFERQKEKFTSAVSELLENFDQTVDFSQSWMNDWVSGMKQVQVHMLDARQLKHLNAPENVVKYGDLAGRELAAIYESYIHMTNNRLGVSNRDEGYIAFIIYTLTGGELRRTET